MNKQLSNPFELARETLKTLASRKVPPTPDNYAKIYTEISGIPTEKNNGAEKVLRGIAERLVQTPKSTSTGITLKKVMETGNWERCLREIEKVLPKQDGEVVQSWSDLIRDLLRQLEITHKGLTITRKKEGVETVLARFAADPETLFVKLSGLVRSWPESQVAANPVDVVSTPLAEPVAGNAAITPAVVGSAPVLKPDSNTEMLGKLSELLAQTLESILSTQPELAQEVRTLAQQVRSIKTHGQVTALAKQLRQFWIKVELRGGDKAKIHEGLVRLLRLLVENIGEMVEDEEWLHGQIAILQEIITNPIDTRAIADAERSLRDAIIKQGMLKQSLADAKITLKSLMTTFIDRLGEITESTGDYHQKIEQELAQVSELVREDQLTGALNRRGLDEAFEREAMRADRSQIPICVALLDIDNFKRLNDTLGHHAGDQALIHLSNVIRDALRPSDLVARYGGEEFNIVLPGIGLKEATATIERLQRELTKKFFLHENERILVTFSAGVTRRAPQELREDVIGRADKAMYQAKHTGKNRVVVAG